MPIYEYVCEKCGEYTEVIQKVTDEPIKRCKKCKGKLEKQISRTSFQLKGSGWYQTDYSSKPKESSGASEEKKGSDEKKKSDSAPTAKTD
ncbi:MAG: FmdB family transcriptional regulator [Blastocatellia bacterium AA13]|nr:MAG: FmdB family transcriptional regulator [Blastocatellia bacterium AA13]